MSGFSAVDSAHMARALTLARRGQFGAHPNPMVGCVVVRGGRVIGEGWHVESGGAHAETNALAAAGDATGATVYLTLEPCAHHGKTPPCAVALIEAHVAEVVFAMHDPFPAVSGRGAALLADAGIRLRSGLMEAQAEELNRGYLSRIRRGRPFVRVKIAASIDGAVAMQSGESRWITGPEARADVQRLRAASGAILSGIGTVIADDPSLTVRGADCDTRGRQPLRAIVDSSLRLPASAAMLALPGATILYCIDDAAQGALEAAGAEVVRVEADAGRVRLEAVLADLGARGVNDLLVEAGPTLAGSLLARGLADELVIYQAPHIMGSNTVRMFETPAWTDLAARSELEIRDVRRVGPDTRITAAVKD